MIEKLKVLAKRWKKKLSPMVVIMTALIIYVGYVHVQLSITQNRQDRIIYTIAKNIENQNLQNVKTHAIAIQAKIDNYQETKNTIVDLGVIDFYQKAYALALNGDKSCYIFEMLGDNMYEMYGLGLKDGNKMWGKRNNSF